jgi:hypothetical protein
MKLLAGRKNDVHNIGVEYKTENINDVIKLTKKFFIADPYLNIQNICSFQN